ncbi:MAG TPA: TIGR00730 family Rossman fold protein [Acidimicrobiales bacterium]|jgi:uncharacterized protein (TIGR00730 family)|nr:TIGR00730 family Rossman fold protein [Acidimicrobiales bacterium]
MTNVGTTPGRRTTGDTKLDADLESLLDDLQVRTHRDLVFQIFSDGARLATDGATRLDLKISAAALNEMRAAFEMFAPWRAYPKVTIFGSARTKPADPLYTHTRDVARELAQRGWMVVTGAGPGIMEAGMEGAGRDHSLGVSIRLPFEDSANDVIEGDHKLVSMKYFFTRKLMLMKESSGFIALPGGFGTLDETFELFTLQQTGKAVPAPTVLLDTPHGGYWNALQHFIDRNLVPAGLISPEDTSLYLITDDVVAAREEILGFYRNYQSIRWVGDRLVVRIKAEPTDKEITELNERFSHLCASGHIARSQPLAAERSSDDSLDLARVVLRYDHRKISALRGLIDALNALDSAPTTEAAPPPPD